MDMWKRMPLLQNCKRNNLRYMVRIQSKHLPYKWPSYWKLSFKSRFLAKYEYFIKVLMRPFWTPVRMTIWLGMPRLENWKIKHLRQKERIWNKQLVCNWQSSWKISFKSRSFSKIGPFLQLLTRTFWSPAWMGMCICMAQQIYWKIRYLR